VRGSGLDVALFSVGDAPPIARTVEVSGLPRLLAHRTLDPLLLDLNARGALNGHVPVTAIVSCAALLTAAAGGYDAVAMANERSASAANVRWHGLEINHQFSKSLRAEELLRGAIAEVPTAPEIFSVLRPASELAIARAFARLEPYHSAFTSCNAVFRLDAERRTGSWCCDCPKCRFVYLALAPFRTPEEMLQIFGRDLLAEPEQYEGFALLTATGGHKPFECVGEEEESLAAVRLLVADARWREHVVVVRLGAEVLPAHPLPAGDPVAALTLGGEHFIPSRLVPGVRALLGS
jgi:UDP-N-acetyl-alpha-D-muramoyl-L-alanyl-L-glutamate epimerase